MRKIAISCDLDDTLAKDQAHYEDAKQELVNLLHHNGCSMEKEDIIDHLDDIDQENYERVGVTKTRFAESCMQTAVDLVGHNISQEAWQIVRSVFKTSNEYGEIGTFKGYDELISTISNFDYTTVVTAGVKDVQENKIEGLGLRDDFDSVNIVDSGSKKEVFEKLDEEYDTVIHIGNSLRSDIEPATSVGIDAIYINTKDWNNWKKDENEYNIMNADTLCQCSELLKLKYISKTKKIQKS